jgi:CubicO group peptidase (beta-lactamase class C family)
LNAAGKAELDTDVNGYLKDWQLRNPFTNHPVTLRQLLCHRAGMVPHGFAGYSEHRPTPSLVEVLNKRHFSLLNGPIKVAQPPGSGYRYSGGGYCVVQKAVEDITCEPFDAAMSELVLQPMGMSRSSFQQPPQDTNNIACGYGRLKALLGGGRWFIYPQKAAAGLWTTPQDLAQFIIAVQAAHSGRTNGPVSPAIAQEFLKPHFDPWQGAGIGLDGSGKDQGFFHGGENLGYFARFGATVSMDRGWVIMSNAQKDRFTPILNAVVQEFGWKRKGDG